MEKYSGSWVLARILKNNRTNTTVTQSGIETVVGIGLSDGEGHKIP